MSRLCDGQDNSCDGRVEADEIDTDGDGFVECPIDAGGWDESYTYGIGHFIGMEVHEHGDYVGPLMPGMVLAIEQGAVVDGTRVAFEDDVLVTRDGYEWLTRFIPIEIDEVEAACAGADLASLKS